eukprot:Gregarina_sp_Poly_1__1690@NODE_1433_length_4160_cov_221_240899_g951_i0_p4_GENE_NODE_1433_length_4160_cov_221_240899_g951_i0NODE_1433_length_4160_cov_221_240899_g951_i0_p4_ORF_typecomplete_len124_score2_55_NODE_1433_length_4160_cov_221_240899_g951_i0204575
MSRISVSKRWTIISNQRGGQNALLSIIQYSGSDCSVHYDDSRTNCLLYQPYWAFVTKKIEILLRGKTTHSTQPLRSVWFPVGHSAETRENSLLLVYLHTAYVGFLLANLKACCRQSPTTSRYL